MLATPHCKNLPCYGTLNKDDAQNVIYKRIFILVLQRRQLNTEIGLLIFQVLSFLPLIYAFPYFLVFYISSSFLSLPFSSFLSLFLFLFFISSLLIVTESWGQK